MTFARWTIRTRLTVWYLAVLALATLLLAGGSWWVMRRSLTAAADNHLGARIDGVERLIGSMARELGPAEMQDEFREYAALTLGDVLLEVADANGLILCRPTLSGWEALRPPVVARASGAPLAIANGVVDDQPYRVAAERTTLGGRTYDIVAALPMGPATDALVRFGWIIGVLAPGVWIAAGIGGYAISRRALTPVDRMTRDAQAMTVRNLDRRLDVPAADDEIRRLAVTFNDMLARLEAGVADMARFTAEAAHELRTPVTLVRTTADLALSRERPEAEYRQALAEVLAHAEQMSALVGELLVLARADAGVEPRETAVVDLVSVATEAARSVGSQSAPRRLTVDVDVPDRPVEIAGDPASLRRLVLILLDNAIKYTTPGGAVRLRVANAPAGDDRAGVVLEVIDTGPGVDPAERSRVFDRFYRGAAARQQVAGGTGLGLSIAQAIVTRHRGTIEIGAGEHGAGCRVRVVLPRS
jgi:heavy metal sensor kinase